MLIVCPAHLVSSIAAQDAEVFEINNDGRSFTGLFVCVLMSQAGWWTGPVNLVLRFTWQVSALDSQLFL